MTGASALLLEVLLKGLVLAGLVAALACRAGPAARVWLLRGLNVTLLAIPLVAMLAVSSGLSFSVSAGNLLGGFEPVPVVAVSPPAGDPVPLAPQESGPPWLFIVWLTGLSLGAISLVRQLLVLRHWQQQASFMGHERAGGRRVQLGWSEAVSSPVSFGWRKPVVLLPAKWRFHPDITRQDLDHALAHELAHVERSDWLWLIVCRLASAAHWCNPLLPRLSRLLAEDTEIVCDRRALSRVNDTAGYAGTLVKAIDVGQASSPAHTHKHQTGPALAMAGTDQWRRRIEYLYRTEAPMHRYSIRLTMAAAVALPLALLQLSNAQPQAPAPAAESAVAPEAPASPSGQEPATPQAPASPAPALEAQPAPAAAPRPAARAAAERAEAARVQEQARVRRDAERAEAERRREMARAERDAERAEARVARDAARAQRDELRASRDQTRMAREEVRRANREAQQEQERLARQLEQLQARIAEIEAELAASKARESER